MLILQKGQQLQIKTVKEWIDFAGAIGTLNVGHSHPKITEHLKNELERFILPGFNVIMYESYIKLAEKLAEITPGDHKRKQYY